MSSADKSKASLSKEAKLTSELAQILDDKNLTDIELETDALSLRISRTPPAQHVISGAAPMAAAPAAPAAPAPVASEAPAETDSASDLSSHPGAVKSPMVGTYYESAEPGAAPFAKVGDKVAKGQTICIIEAMKVMNTITAPQAGSVKHVACENGQPVEFDQLLIVIE